MSPIATYHHFGLFAFLILIAGLVFIVWRWPEGKHLTFSQHVAMDKHRILYYVGLFSIVLPLLMLFFIGWFVPRFQLSAWFSVFIVVSAVTQYACTLIPEVGGWKTRYHRILAGLSAAALLPPLIMVLMSTPISQVARLVTDVSLLAMLGIIYLITAGKGKHEYFLYLQMGYFAAFFVAVLLATYL
jgi:hypothetical protein